MSDDVRLIQPVSMGPVLTQEDLDQEGLPNIPGDVLQLSIALGIDLTPEQDLEERLDGLVTMARELQGRLRQLADHIESYERTVVDHEPVDREL